MSLVVPGLGYTVPNGMVRNSSMPAQNGMPQHGGGYQTPQNGMPQHGGGMYAPPQYGTPNYGGMPNYNQTPSYGITPPSGPASSGPRHGGGYQAPPQQQQPMPIHPDIEGYGGAGGSLPNQWGAGNNGQWMSPIPGTPAPTTSTPSGPPLIDRLFDNFGGGSGGSSGGGLFGNQPTINANPIYTQQQTQQQINKAQANNIVDRDTRNKRALESLGGSGFSGNSPQMAAIRAQNDVSRSIADQRASTDIPLQHRQANSQNMLNAQSAQEGQYRNRQLEDIARQQSQLGFMSPILQSLFGMVGGFA